MYSNVADPESNGGVKGWVKELIHGRRVHEPHHNL